MPRLLLAFILLLSVACPASALGPTGRRWTKTETGSLIVYSNARDGVTKTIVASLERMRVGVEHAMSLRSDAAVPVTVFVFSDEAAFAPVRKLALGESAKNQPGFFTHQAGRYFIALETSSDGGVDRIVYHELTHAIIEKAMVGLPLWYQEGIAEFYSTFRSFGKTVRVGELPPGYVDFLAETGLMPLRQVFSIDQKSKEYTNMHAGNFYATSWLVLHYLLVGAPQRAGQLGRFLQLLDAGKPADAACQAAFGVAPEQLQGELGSYLHRPKKQFMSYELAAVNAIAAPAPVAVDEAEMLRAIEPMFSRAEH